MTVNFFAIKETRFKKYLYNAPCYSTWVFADEDTSHSATDYLCHFAGYIVFPNEGLNTVLRQHSDGGIEYLAVVEDATPEGANLGTWTYARMIPSWDVDRDRDKTLIRWAEIDWDDVLENDDFDNDTAEEILEKMIEGAVDSGYPDIERLRSMSMGRTVYGFSEHDFRHIKGCPDILLERPPGGGLHLSHLTEDNRYFKRRYFFHTESQARQDFWEYLQEQGVKPEVD